MMTIDKFIEIVDRISYRQWRFVPGMRDDHFTLHVGFHADGEEWTSRKWLISRHATPSEVVQTAFKAVLTAEEHEVREHFMVDGVAALGPHLDIERLIAVARSGEIDARPRAIKLAVETSGGQESV